MHSFAHDKSLTPSLTLVASVSLFALACSSSEGASPPGIEAASTSTASGGAGTSAQTASTGAESTTGSDGTTATGSTTATAGSTTGEVTSVSASTTGTTTSAGTTTGDASTSAGGAGSTTASSTTGSPETTLGCGATTWPEDGEQTLEVDGVTREFIVAIPEGYATDTPHRLVFAFHGRTGTAQQIAGGFNGGYYGLENRMDDTIFIAPQGLGTDEDPGDTGWPNNDGEDIAFVEAMLDYLESSYCVDSARVYSTGFSYGGIMSNTIACQLGSRFRAVAPMAGALFSFGQNSCVGEPVAAWFTHGTMDDQVAYENGESARDAILETNGCDANATEPVDPAPCVSYQNCQAGYPVHWCQTDLGHTMPDFASDGVAAFFLSF